MRAEFNNTISKRVDASIKHLQVKDYEQCLLNLFPAIDRTAKLRRNSDGVGSRFKKFIADQFDIITVTGFGSLIGKNCLFGDVKCEHALYQLARNPLIHEGGFSSDMEFVAGGASVVGGQWQLSDKIVLALILAVISAKENHDKQLINYYEISFLEEAFSINSLWGKEAVIKQKIKKKFDRF